MSAAALLRQARAQAGMSQRQLARRARMPQPEVSRIERGHVSPRLETLDRLLRASAFELVLTPRLGARVDRSLIAERLGLSVADRLRVAVEEWHRTAAFRRLPR